MDIGGGGMLVTTSRPLAVDETLHFTVTTDAGVHLDGDARVMRCERPDVYALKVEHPDEVLLDQLERLVRQAQGDAVGRPA